jgi:hypothetical protein
MQVEAAGALERLLDDGVVLACLTMCARACAAVDPDLMIVRAACRVLLLVSGGGRSDDAAGGAGNANDLTVLAGPFARGRGQLFADGGVPLLLRLCSQSFDPSIIGDATETMAILLHRPIAAPDPMDGPGVAGVPRNLERAEDTVARQVVAEDGLAVLTRLLQFMGDERTVRFASAALARLARAQSVARAAVLKKRESLIPPVAQVGH